MRKNTKRLIAFTIVIAFALCLVALPSANAVTTTTVTVEVKNSLGTGIDGVPVRYYDGSWHTFGTTGTAGTGKCSLVLSVGNYAFDVSYAHATQQKWQVVSGPTDTVSFQTTEVTMKVLAHDGTTVLTGTNAQYYTGTWYTFGSGTTTTSMELLPGNYAFKVSLAGTTNQKWQDVAGTTTLVTFQTTLVTMKILASDGTTELPGTNAQYYPGTWLMFDSGSTTSSMELLPGNYAFSASYQHTTNQKWQVIGAGPNEEVVFQTTLVTMKVLASDHTTELPGTNAKYYTGSWYQFDSGSTTSTMELLPGNYAFGVTYNGIYQQKWQDVGVNQVVVFDTTKVTLQFSGSIKYYTGTWYTFTKPSIYMFPGTYPFQFDGYQTNIVVGNTDMEQSMVVVKFLKSGGAGISGGAAQYYDGSWHPMGSTDGSGVLIYGIPGLKGNLAFSMTYAGASTQKWQNIQADSIVVFRTAPVTMKLFAHDGSTPLTGTGAQYYTGVWNTFGTGTTTTSMELLPGNYCFKVTYAGASQQKWQTIALDPVNVVFQTTMVTMKLNDHSGNKLTPGGTSTQYYTGVWNNFGSGTTETSMELLPGNYAFRVSYNGASQQKWQVIGAGPMEDVVFQTTEVTMELKDHIGGALTGTSPKYYTGTWNNFGTLGHTTDSMELLPGNYAFSVSYNGATQQKWQNVGTNPNVVFQTTEVTMRVEKADHTELAGTDAKYYTGVWNTFGTGNTIGSTMELLPGNYAFKVSYAGTTNQKWQLIGTGPSETVTFQTTLVTMKVIASDGSTELTGSDAKYYTGTWNIFDSGTTTSSMELLPGNYAFKVSYNGATQQKWQNVGSDPVVKFQTTKVTLQFSGMIKYYTGVWNPYTKPSMDLLPGTYTFKFDTYQMNLVISSDIVKSIVVVKLLNSGGGGIAGGDAQYYDGGWQSIGTTPSSGVLLYAIPGLKGSLTFGVNYAGARQEKTQNIATDSYVVFQTMKVTMKLLDSAGTKELASSKAEYYAGGWHTLGSGTTTTSMELLPASYSFGVEYAGARQEKSQNVASDPNVVFKTKLVTFKLLDSTNTEIIGAGTEYYASGWHTFGGGSTTATMELLPLTYSFKVRYAGASQEKSQNVGADSNVVFNTKLVTMTLYDHDKTNKLTGCAEYYAGGWKTFGGGSTTATMELLPLTYTFRVSYVGASQEKTQNVGSDASVDFQTIQVTMKLRDSTDSKDLGGAGQYYASGWKDFGTTEAKKELLPGTYSFSVDYAGARVEKSQNIVSSSIVFFQTGKVHSDSGTCTLYYANGWKAFTQDIELLPVKTTFHFSDGTPDTSYNIIAATTNNIH